MEKDYWLGRWNEGKTAGFHQPEGNPFLQKYWQETGAKEGDAVLVPLCGKTYDMIWLRDKGHPVTGVEFSALAVAGFFKENGIAAVNSTQGRFASSAGADIHLLCGDFFDITAEDVREVKAVYDRAALIALPPDTRKKYIAHLKKILPGRPVLLVTLEYPEGAISGPPFSVTEGEVTSLFGASQVRLLERHDALAENPQLRERGVGALHECAYLGRLGT